MKNLPLLPQRRDRENKEKPAGAAKEEGIAVDIQKEQQLRYYPPLQSIHGRTNTYIYIHI
jgi:hypothetical protein